MTRNHTEGMAETLGSKIKEAAGRLTGDDGQVAEARGEQITDQVTQDLGGVRKAAGDLLGRTGGQEQAAGQTEEIMGGLQERLGTATHDRTTQADGQVRQAQGTVKKGLGTIKQSAEEHLRI